MEENIRNYKLVRNLLIGIFGLIILSSVKIQVIEGRKYYRLSEENRIQKRYIPAPRGKIYDRKRKELANTRPGFYVSVMQTLVNDTTLEKIAQILNTDVQSIKDKMKMEKNRFKTVKIAHDISSAQLSLIE
jgi:penicillin-binding protein 2